jgi:Type II secretion system (T2SS), protein N
MSSDLKLKHAFLFGLVIFLLTVIVEAPSTLLSSMLVEFSQQHLGLAKERGTIWKGDADLVAVSENQKLTLGHLNWQFHAQSLLDKFVTISLVWNDNAPIQLLVTRGGFKISRLNVDLPASAVA